MKIHIISKEDKYLNPTTDKILFLNDSIKVFINDILKIKDDNFLVVGRETTIFNKVVWKIKKIN